MAVLFVFWRWLTCGHGRHRWQLNSGIDLASPDGWNVFVIVARHCSRCGTTEVLE